MDIRGIAGAAVLLLVTGCSGSADGAIDSTETMCDDFARHVQAGMPQGERTEVARHLAEVRDNADPAVKEGSVMLSRTANATGGAYQTAADTFAQACFDAGWEG